MTEVGGRILIQSGDQQEHMSALSVATALGFWINLCSTVLLHLYTTAVSLPLQRAEMWFQGKRSVTEGPGKRGGATTGEPDLYQLPGWRNLEVAVKVLRQQAREVLGGAAG